MPDEGVHEIQLNGKQLVFMFMAVTVVAVVIFLCGVMVGRGVRAPRAVETADAATEAPIDPTASVQTPAPPSTDGPSSAPGSSQEKLTYADRSSTTTPPPQTLKDPVQEVKPASAVKAPVAEPPPVAPAVKTTTKPAASDAAGGFVVQVAAVKERSEADTIAKRLK